MTAVDEGVLTEDVSADEAPLEPARAIIDPHLHVWDIPALPGAPQLPQRFLLPELLATVERSGHRITHTVFVECHAMYRADGPEVMKPLGEVEFANGMAAMSASGQYGPCRVAHRIVGSANLLLGDGVAPVLEAQLATAGERFRGIRFPVAYSAAGLFGHPCDPAQRDLLRDPNFVAGARVLAARGLSLDVWCLHTQLDDLMALARAVPELTIVLNHVGTPDYRAAGAGREREVWQDWTGRMAALSHCDNVVVKLSGLGMDVSRPVGATREEFPSEVLAQRWRPTLEACIEQFGARRSMFASNFPPDNAAGSYGALWNAFKRVVAEASADEKDALFRRTAAATYRIALDDPD